MKVAKMSAKKKKSTTCSRISSW